MDKKLTLSAFHRTQSIIDIAKILAWLLCLKAYKTKLRMVYVCDLKQRIAITVPSVEGDMFRCVFGTNNNICRVTKGSHKERL
jgi:hypothetical protein